jgi:hypothetical protein
MACALASPGVEASLGVAASFGPDASWGADPSFGAEPSLGAEPSSGPLAPSVDIVFSPELPASVRDAASLPGAVASGPGVISLLMMVVLPQATTNATAPTAQRREYIEGLAMMPVRTAECQRTPRDAPPSS